MTPGVYAHFRTSEGEFTARLFDADAPNTVANFVGLAEGTKEWTDPRNSRRVKTPYYDGTIFHRVIAGFMIQGGDPLGQGTGGPGFTFADEFTPTRRHDRAGVLSMANRGPNTNGGQFFIVFKKTELPDPTGYSIFGRVTQGMDIVDRIAEQGTGGTIGPEAPKQPISILDVTVEKAA